MSTCARVDGIRLSVHPGSSSDLCGVTLAVTAGLRDEAADEAGLAHLLEHLAWGVGDVNRDHLVFGKTAEDVTTITSVCLLDSVDAVIKEMACRLRGPYDNVDRIRAECLTIRSELRLRVRNDVRQQRERAAIDMLLRPHQLAYTSHKTWEPDNCPGTEAVSRFHRRLWCGAPVCLAVTGPVDPATVSESVAVHFGKRPESDPVSLPRGRLQTARRRLQRLPAESGTGPACCTAFLVDVGDAHRLAALTVLARVLTDGAGRHATLERFGTVFGLRRPAAFTLSAPHDRYEALLDELGDFTPRDVATAAEACARHAEYHAADPGLFTADLAAAGLSVHGSAAIAELPDMLRRIRPVDVHDALSALANSDQLTVCWS